MQDVPEVAKECVLDLVLMDVQDVLVAPLELPVLLRDQVPAQLKPVVEALLLELRQEAMVLTLDLQAQVKELQMVLNQEVMALTVLPMALLQELMVQ